MICYSTKQLCCVFCLRNIIIYVIYQFIFIIEYWKKETTKCLSIFQICIIHMNFENISDYIHIHTSNKTLTISRWVITVGKCTFQNLNEILSNCVYCCLWCYYRWYFWHDITSNKKYDGVFCGKHCKKSWVVETLFRCEQEWLWCANTQRAETWIS